MTISLFMKHIREFGKRVLHARGFIQKTKWTFEKELPGFYQGLSFRKGTRGLQGYFTVEVFWRFNHSPLSFDDVMHCSRRIGEFTSGRGEWLPIDDESIFERIEQFFIQTAEPFLNENGSIEAIISNFEEGRYEASLLFGYDIGWRTYNIGFCYLWLGKKKKGLSYLHELLERYSDEEFDWVQQRKKVSLDAIASLKE